MVLPAGWLSLQQGSVKGEVSLLSLHCLHLRDSDWFSVQSFTHSMHALSMCSVTGHCHWHMAMSLQSHFFVLTVRDRKGQEQGGMGQISGWGTCRGRSESWGAFEEWRGWDPRHAEQCWSLAAWSRQRKCQGRSMAEGWRVGKLARFQDRRQLVLLIFHLTVKLILQP